MTFIRKNADNLAAARVMTAKNTQSFPKKENKIARRWRALFEGLSESTAAAPSVNHDCRMNLAFVYPDFD